MVGNSTLATTGDNYYDGTDTSSSGGYYYRRYEYYDSTPTQDEKKIVIPKDKIIFNRNKISNINIKLKQRILPVNKQVRFTVRNAL